MAKDKKKDQKKDKQADDLLDNAAKSLKKFRKVTKHMTRLSTGQKLVGGLALLAAGLTYLAKKQAEMDATSPTGPASDAPDAAPAKQPTEAAAETARLTTGEAAALVGAVKPTRKSKKSKQIPGAR